MYDLAVIGLGSAGIEAISIALKNNLNVIAFEKGDIGGTCLNRGCIPTKAILHSANLFSEIKSSKNLGISLDCEPKFSFEAILDRKTEIVNKFKKAVELSISKNITIVKENAEIILNNGILAIKTNNNQYQAKNIIIATGSIPYELPDLKFDHKFILNSDDMFELKELPKKITIVGSGAIGLEWSQILSSLEVEVNLIEKAPMLAPALDIDIQKRLDRILKLKNINVFKNDFIIKAEGKKITLNSGKTFDTDLILSAVGRKNILPKANIEIEIKENYKTNIENVYVIGDASKDIMLAHSASFQARKVLDHILFNKEIKKSIVPSVVYITPEIASAGLKEQDIENKDEYKILKFMIPSLAKSWCDDKADGFIKVIMKDDLIKGAHIVSNCACELISTFLVLINQKVKKQDILDTIFPHPGYSEAILEIIKNG